MLAPGLLVGNYRLLSLLGAGGMGVVWVAEHVNLGSRAAIKFLTPDAARNDDVLRRFANEARTAASLKHRHVVQVHDFGRTDDEQFYIALEYLDGNPLSRLMHTWGGPFEPAQILQVLCQAANGLEAAHARGIVHRDIKPDNLFLTETPLASPGSMDRHVTVIDFGICKLHEKVGGLSTRSHVIMGTPPYMSPEQLHESREVDARADVYALGVIAYEMTTGVRPWGDVTSPPAVYELQRHRPDLRDPRNAPVAPTSPRPEISDAWAAAIAHALEPDRARRCASAREFALSLAAALPGTTWRANGFEILDKYAPELRTVSPYAETAGRPVGPDAIQTISAIPLGVASSAGPSSGGGAHAARTPGDPTPMMLGSPATPTTLRSAAAETRPTRHLRRTPLIAAAVVALAIVAVAFIAGGADEADRSAAAQTTSEHVAAPSDAQPVAIEAPPDAAPVPPPAPMIVDAPPPSVAKPEKAKRRPTVPNRRSSPTQSGATSFNPDDVPD
jgi:eukaryotic-like serine/threonine-protein kinase